MLRVVPGLDPVLNEVPSLMQTTKRPMMAPQSSKDEEGLSSFRDMGEAACGSRNPSVGGRKLSYMKAVGSAQGLEAGGWWCPAGNGGSLDPAGHAPSRMRPRCKEGSGANRAAR